MDAALVVRTVIAVVPANVGDSKVVRLAANRAIGLTADRFVVGRMVGVARHSMVSLRATRPVLLPLLAIAVTDHQGIINMTRSCQLNLPRLLLKLLQHLCLHLILPKPHDD